jgi:hypothetical protein
MRRHKATHEEKALSQLEKIISDLRLDVDYLGWLIAFQSPNVFLRRLQEIVETATHNKEKKYDDTDRE